MMPLSAEPVNRSSVSAHVVFLSSALRVAGGHPYIFPGWLWPSSSIYKGFQRFKSTFPMFVAFLPGLLNRKHWRTCIGQVAYDSFQPQVI